MASDLDRLREKLEGIVGSDYTAAALAHGPLDITSQVGLFPASVS